MFWNIPVALRAEYLAIAPPKGFEFGLHGLPVSGFAAAYDHLLLRTGAEQPPASPEASFPYTLVRSAGAFRPYRRVE
jgi:hypothetical protein